MIRGYGGNNLISPDWGGRSQSDRQDWDAGVNAGIGQMKVNDRMRD
jgi:hypothetical protein